MKNHGGHGAKPLKADWQNVCVHDIRASVWGTASTANELSFGGGEGYLHGVPVTGWDSGRVVGTP